MASPLATWDKNHPSLGNLRYHLGIVPGAAIHPVRLVAQITRHFVDHRLNMRRHLRRLTEPHALDRDREAPFLSSFVSQDIDALKQTLQNLPRDIPRSKVRKAVSGTIFDAPG